MTLQDAVDAFLAGTRRQGGAPHKEQARIILCRMAKWLEEKPDPSDALAALLPVPSLQQLTIDHIDAFLDFREQQKGIKAPTLSPHTINKEIRYIRCFLRYASEDRLKFELSTDWRIPRPKNARILKRRPRYLDPNQLNVVFLATRFAKRPQFPDISPPEWWQTLMLVAFHTSMRRRALFGCPRPTEEELKQRILRLPAEYDKSGEDRIYPLTSMACAMIRRLPCKPGDPMFRWPGTYRSMYRTMEAFQSAAGIPKGQQSRLHVLRKSTATHMLQQGAEATTVQRQMCHSDLQMTMDHYAGDITDLQREAVDRLYIPPMLIEHIPEDPDEPDPIASD